MRVKTGNTNNKFRASGMIVNRQTISNAPTKEWQDIIQRQAGPFTKTERENWKLSGSQREHTHFQNILKERTQTQTATPLFEWYLCVLFVVLVGTVKEGAEQPNRPELNCRIHSPTFQFDFNC